MLTLHLIICLLALLAGAALLRALFTGNNPASLAVVVLTGSALISLTGFALPSPPGTPMPDPARILGGIELVVVAAAALALYARGLAGSWRSIYVVAVALAVYFNVFVAITQAFQKIPFLHALAPTGKEPAFLIAQLLALALFVAIAVMAVRRFSRSAVRVAV
jgi:hypothetical protein